MILTMNTTMLTMMSCSSKIRDRMAGTSGRCGKPLYNGTSTDHQQTSHFADMIILWLSTVDHLHWHWSVQDQWLTDSWSSSLTFVRPRSKTRRQGDSLHFSNGTWTRVKMGTLDMLLDWSLLIHVMVQSTYLLQYCTYNINIIPEQWLIFFLIIRNYQIKCAS